MSRKNKWFVVMGSALLATAMVGCAPLEDDAEDDADEQGVDAVRISGRFEITVPPADVWAGATDLNDNVDGVQVRVEVHQTFAAANPWTNHGNERRTSYRVITTGEENVRGNPRTMATSSMGAFRAVDGAFVRDGALYLVGNATGGRVARTGATRNEKPVIAGIAFNSRAAADSITTAALVEDIRTFTFPAGSGPVVFDTPAFAQRWTDTHNGENFACYNINDTGGQFLAGTSPTDFRSVTGGFVLNGNLFALGQATGGARATPGVPGGFTAVAPRRALGHYGTGARGTAVNFNTTVTNLPSP